MHEGDFPAAIQHLEHAYQISAIPSLAQRVRPIDWRVHIRAFASFALWVSGYPARATASAREAFEVAHQTSRQAAVDRVFACWWSGICLTSCSVSPHTARALSDEEYTHLSLSMAYRGLRQLRAVEAWVLVQLGQIEAGLSANAPQQD